MERITNATLTARAHNVNHRLARADVDRTVYVQGRNGGTGLDVMRPSDGATLETLTFGTKREVADFLHAMMVGIDLHANRR